MDDLDKQRVEENERLAKELADAPRLRDIEVCKNCWLFRKHNNGGGYGYCGCDNHPKFYGHPWCKETVFFVTEKLFEKVRIHLAYPNECKFSDQKPM